MGVRLRFYVSPEKDREYVKKYFPVFEKVFGKKVFESMLRRRADPRSIEREAEKVESRWREVEKRFFGLTGERFGKWKRKTYLCHVSSTYVCGGGYEYPAVIVFPFSGQDPLKTIMHELLHLHVIEDAGRLGLVPGDWMVFSEVAVAFMTAEIGGEFDLPVAFPNDSAERKFRRIRKKVGKGEWSERIREIADLV